VKVPVSGNETAATLRGKMIKAGPRFLCQTLEAIAGGRSAPKAQDHQQATLAPRLTKELGALEWGKSAAEIERLVRGLLPWPAAYTFYEKRLLKVLEAQVVDEDCSKTDPGTVLRAGKEGIVVATGHSGLLVKKVHLQDAKPMDAHSFLIGHRLEAGYRFQ